jgi:hypothetical protein
MRIVVLGSSQRLSTSEYSWLVGLIGNAVERYDFARRREGVALHWRMHMTRSPLIIILTALITTVGVGTANGQANRHFLGLWEGVDINDGSKRTISITDLDGDGTFEVMSRDSFWTLCDGDRGLEWATGGVRRDGVLETDGFVTCFDDAPPLPIRQTYEFVRREDTLVATPHVTTLVPIVLHRVSR